MHSFRNEGTDDVKVITGFEPQGFERFFLEYGVDVDEAGAFETSVSEATIARVIDGCAPVRNDPRVLSSACGGNAGQRSAWVRSPH